MGPIYARLAGASHNTGDDEVRQRRRALLASTIGSFIEWYDFLLYTTAAGVVFGALFFVKGDPLAATLAALSIQAVGFVARPVGGIIFGPVGDRLGRKSTLIITLILTGGSTALVGQSWAGTVS